MERENGASWQPGVPCSELVPPGRVSGADRRAEGLLVQAPTGLASVAEEGEEMLCGPQHRHVGHAYSWVGQAQTHCHSDSPREAARDPLLECSEAGVAASGRQVLSWDHPQHSCSPAAQAVKKGQAQEEIECYLL